WMGCGADANPLPRSKVELCEKYGKELAHAVDEVLQGDLVPVTGNFGSGYKTIPLAFAALPPKEKWQEDSLSKETARRNRALRILKTLQTNGKLDEQYDRYPVQVWKLGGQLTWIALGGEVV